MTYDEHMLAQICTEIALCVVNQIGCLGLLGREVGKKSCGKAPGKPLTTGVGKGREARASAHAHLLLVLLLACLSLLLQRSSTGRGEAAFCRMCSASEMTRILNVVIVLSL